MNNIEFLLGKDLKLDRNQDLIFNIDLVVTNDYEGIIQKIVNKLMSFPISLYLNPNWGGLLQSNVGIQMTTRFKDKLYPLIKNEVLEEPEVEDVRDIRIDLYSSESRCEIKMIIVFRGNKKPISTSFDYQTLFKNNAIYFNNLIASNFNVINQ